jgi:hypothetical protein
MGRSRLSYGKLLNISFIKSGFLCFLMDYTTNKIMGRRNAIEYTFMYPKMPKEKAESLGSTLSGIISREEKLTSVPVELDTVKYFHYEDTRFPDTLTYVVEAVSSKLRIKHYGKELPGYVTRAIEDYLGSVSP